MKALTCYPRFWGIITSFRFLKKANEFLHLFWRPAIVVLTLFALLIPATRLPSGSYALFFAAPLIWVGYREKQSLDFRLWTAYAASFVAFAVARPFADSLGFPVHTSYPILIDRLIGLGVVPTVWLQAHRSAFLDWTAISIHMSYYFAPPLVALYVWRRRNCFQRYAFTLIVIYGISLLIHIVLPTAPPWLAAQEGSLHGVNRLLYSLLFPELYVYGLCVAGGNDVAAMPSVHMAVSTVMGCAIGHHGWIYPIAMGLSLVYIGEHYVIDVLVGAMLALTIWRWIPLLLNGFRHDG